MSFYLNWTEHSDIYMYVHVAVADKMESIDHPLHEAAKRGNLTFMKECIDNRVTNTFLLVCLIVFLYFIV